MSQQKVSEKVQETFFNKLLAIPANNECADCKNKSPSWVSLEFGVFVCIRCSGVHRQLGPHITRVRSTRLDGWVQENMDIMGNVGNKIANTYYENKISKNNRRPGPNSSMEECRKFIDDKYIKKLWAPRDIEEPVKEYHKSLKTGEQPNFNYSPTKDEREGEGNSIKAVRKRSLSLDKLQNQQQQDLLTDDLLGGGPTGGSGSQNDFGDFNQAHAHSASPRNHQEVKQDGGWNWDLANNTTNTQNNTNGSNLNNLYNNNAGQNGQQQQQKTIDIKSLYSQPGGMSGGMSGMSGMGGMGQNNPMMGNQGGWGQGQTQGAWGGQGMQGMQGGFQQGGFGMGGGNMGQMGGFNNNFGGQQNFQQQNMMTQQMRYGMGGMGNMVGMQGMGGMQNTGFQQGQMNNQFGNNQFQSGFGGNQFQKQQQQNNAGFGWK